MKKLYLLLFSIVVMGSSIQAQNWVQFVTDASGDASAGLDGEAAYYFYDDVNDSIWFRIDVGTITSMQMMDFGINIMINIPGSSAGTFNFWGASNTDAYHKLVTVWVTGSPPSSYTGTIGISDAAGVMANNYTSLHSNNISIKLDAGNNMVILGMKRTDLITDTEMGGNKIDLKTAVATGTSQFWGDDVYDPTASITIDKTGGSIGLGESSNDGFTFYPQPANDDLYLSGIEHNSTIQMVNSSGVLVLSSTSYRDQISLDISSLTPGIYLLLVEHSGSLKVGKKIIIE